MKAWMLHILVFLITLASVQLGQARDLDFNYSLEDALSAEPVLKDVPLNNPSSKNQIELNFISFNLSQMASLLKTELKVISNFYYLPIYVLIRLKDFFLLI
jgi:hypothetical protein